MNKLMFLSIIALLSVFNMQAQDNACDGSRYKDKIFTNTQTEYNITFGSATTLGGNLESLEMDIYTPVGDDFTNRPLVILAFGGSFIVGDRNDMAPFCADLARRGFVTATIDYRLIDTFIFDSIAASEEVILARSDMKAAIRYLRNDAQTENNYGIDPDKIFVGGISAGAILACHAAYIDEDDEIPSYIQDLLDDHGGFEGESNDETLGVSSEVSGVLNFSGGLGRDHWLDWNDSPIYSAHDELDEIVICGYGSSSAFFFDFYGYGSCSLNERANEVGQYSELYLVEGSNGHVSYFTDAGEFLNVMDESAEFLEYIICDYVSVDEIKDVDFSIYPNPSSGMLTVESGNIKVNYYQLINSLGQLVQREYFNGITLDLSNMNKGLYQIQFFIDATDNSPITSKSIILE